jgi:hypothetical protein
VIELSHDLLTHSFLRHDDGVLFVIASVSEAIQSRKNWIASSQEFLAMTPVKYSDDIAKHNIAKKEQGTKPCSKIVSTLFPRKFGFDLD